MQQVMEEDENDTVASPTTPGARFHGPWGGDSAADQKSFNPSNPNTFPAHYNFARRTSVSAESLKPNTDGDDNWRCPVFPKSQEQLERLKNALSANFLFSHLHDEQSAQILGAFVEKPVPVKGIKVSYSLPQDVMKIPDYCSRLF